MKVLVTGANGQLGQDVVLLFRKDHEVLGLGRDGLDITNADQVRTQVLAFHPDVIIHCAAYTAVDLAETEVVQAYAVNAVGTRNLAVAAQEVGAKICYISTDYVFNGTGTQPYREYDNTDPQSVYGASKRAGEILTQTLNHRYFIVRTSWVYGEYGNNFVKTMLKFGRERDELKVVHDQIGSPTYTVDLAQFLLELVQTDKFGVYHASNTGACSWFEFAQAIFEEASIEVRTVPCTTEEFPRPAKRPSNSVMEHLSIRTNGLTDLRPWREALRDFLSQHKG
ncbi:dTDP-4-dehydrorhamnose reductase [Paenibacillus swuensis]|uniref:dTDP-4-dehydrorhamnose reductase n=1 Tax=Paenibacillus swuensis TaxID=1178515 RepID=A0A172TJ43_9BACL|nr:dTDP-4-dehydrorhamnose reductase [Paenibacillus swuensis]ANE47058.1 dTDP-4-dehydrorhamnose reductase [Paenibacillus swuensis]